MTNQEILTKAIQKAIDGGWKQNLIWIHGNVKNPNEIFMKQLEIDSEHIYWAYDEYISVPELIFNHDFAKALWGEELHHHVFVVPKGLNKRFVGTNEFDVKPVWKHHLQAMVIAPDPIAYLAENI